MFNLINDIRNLLHLLSFAKKTESISIYLVNETLLNIIFLETYFFIIYLSNYSNTNIKKYNIQKMNV